MIKNKIKLVIWDLDDTFWRGTLSEGEVEVPPENIRIIKQLANRGIVSSISSKNDYNHVMEKIRGIGLDDYFVLPVINWGDKGAQVKEIIEHLKLRPDNVLFIDDNSHNIAEVSHFCPNINTEFPDAIEYLLSNEFLKGEKDDSLKKLKQYKLIERKVNERKEYYGSDTEFLQKSNIRVDIMDDCLEHKERLFNLINKSNQLNFTKVRYNTIEELEDHIKDESVKSIYVKVKDNFGDYGICGFVSIKDRQAVHFCFSCRLIGMGVEKWVYEKLNKPILDIVEPVIGSLESEGSPFWINQKHCETGNVDDVKIHRKILLKGGCDLNALYNYLNIDDVKTEFNALLYHRDHTVYAIDFLQRKGNLQLYKRFIDEIPFLYDDSFTTEMFNKEYDIVVYSLLMDYTQAIYKYIKDENIKIAQGGWMCPYKKGSPQPYKEYGYDEKEMEFFYDNFVFQGESTADDMLNNLAIIRRNMHTNQKLILINGCEILVDSKSELENHKTFNAAVDKFVIEHNNTYLLDMRKIITSREFLTDSIRHYRRSVYYEMARELTKMLKII